MLEELVEYGRAGVGNFGEMWAELTVAIFVIYIYMYIWLYKKMKEKLLMSCENYLKLEFSYLWCCLF